MGNSILHSKGFLLGLVSLNMNINLDSFKPVFDIGPNKSYWALDGFLI